MVIYVVIYMYTHKYKNFNKITVNTSNITTVNNEEYETLKVNKYSFHNSSQHS